MEGWWMVHTTVRPVLTVLRTVRMTIAAALASSPAPHQLMSINQSIDLGYRAQMPGQGGHVCVWFI